MFLSALFRYLRMLYLKTLQPDAQHWYRSMMNNSHDGFQSLQPERHTADDDTIISKVETPNCKAVFKLCQ